jgi:hypothetical protein
MNIKKASLSIALLSLIPSASFAAGIDILGDIDKTGKALYGSDAAPIDPKVIIANIVRIILGFLGFIFILLVLYSGFRWMTSEGNEKTIDAAKSTIRSATIGLVLVLTGFAIASFISSNLQRAVNKQQTNPPIEQPHG